MKNLEEAALESLEEIKATEITVETHCYRNGWGHYPLKKLMADFARQQVHQALDEASEKAKIRKMEFSRWMSMEELYNKNPYEVDKDSILKLKEKY